MWGWMSLERVGQDLRYAIRTLRRDAALTVFAVLIVGLGVGASTTVFSVVNAVLLRPLPFHAAERLVWISNIADDGVSEWRTQVNHVLDLRERNRSFSDLAGYFGFVEQGNRLLTGEGEAERLSGVDVTENFFPFLGVEPVVGRNFSPEECQFNGPKAVLLSYGIWQSRFSGDRAVVGQTIVVDNQSVTVVGVLPESFDFGAVFAPGLRVDVFRPFPLSEQTNRYGNTLAMIGRLVPGATVESARREFTALGQKLTQEYTNRNSIRPKLTALNERITGRFRLPLLVLGWAVGMVMLIVCANISNLQLARMARRQKEMAVRVALGAGRGRLVRQLLTESVLLSCCGAAVGVLLAAAGMQVISQLEAFDIPLLESVRLDGAALGFTTLAAVLTGVLFGLMPALQVPSVAVHTELKDSNRGSSQGKQHGWTRGVFVVSEVAFAFVLLVGAGLLVRSFVRVLNVDLGFQPERLAALQLSPDPRSNLGARNTYFDETLRRAQAIPGIRDAALTDILPLGGNRSWGIAGVGQTYDRGAYPQAFVRVVSEGYFEAMGVPLVMGRDFHTQDRLDSEPVVVLNAMLAEMLWPREDPIGKKLTDGNGSNGRLVVGVVGNVRHQSLEEGYTGEMYLPIRQTYDYSAVNLVVRTDLPPNAFASSVRAALTPIAPNLAANEWQTQQALIDKAVSPRRFLVFLLAGFAVFALVLASLGIYAVISYSVSQRQQEIGIRMALGASAAELQRSILTQTLKLAAIGAVIGLAGSWALGRAIQNLLFDVAPSDPLTFVGALAALAAVAAAAGYLPARRASRLNPVEALGAE